MRARVRGALLAAATATLLSGTVPAGAATITAHVDGACSTDDSVIIEICVDQYYKEYTSSGTRYVEVDYYNITYTRLDRQVALGTTYEGLGAYGRCGTGCTGILTHIDKLHQQPTSGVTLRLVPSFHGKYVNVSAATYYQCASARLTYTRGTRSYSFTAPNQCQGFEEPTDLGR